MAKEKRFKNKTDIFAFICIGASWITVGALITLFIISVLFHTEKHFPVGTITNLKTTWTYTTGSGVTGECVFPKVIDMPYGESIDISSVLTDDIKDGDYLLWRTSRHYKLYIDGELRSEYNGEDIWLPGRGVKYRTWAIPLSSEDRGKTIRVTKDEEKTNNGVFYRMYYGDMYGIVTELWREHGFRFIAYLLLFIISIVLLAINIGIYNIYRINNLSFRLLAYGMMAVSVWALTDSYLYQMILGDNFYSGLVGYIITPIMAIVFIRYMDEVQQSRYKKTCVMLISALLLDELVICVLHFTDTLSLQRTLAGNDAVVAITSAIGFFLIIRDAINGRIKEYKWVAIGLVLFIILVGYEIAFINLVIEYPTGICMVIGVYALMTCAMIHTVGDILNSEREKRAAIDASIVKTTFLANMSHEIRTPINSIIGMNEMILRENNDKDIAVYSDHIKRSCNLLMSIIGDVLDFSKIEAGRFTLVADPYKSADLVNDLCAFLSEQASPKSLEVKTDISSNIPSVLEGDVNRIKQIVINLITNAAKYTKTGHIGLKVYSTEVPVDKDREKDKDKDKDNDKARFGKDVMLNFEVEDTGIGIREEDCAKLFNSFTRIEEKKNRNIQGTGLGLSIVKALTEIMGGEVDVKSAYGKGSTFIVRIPQHVIDDLPIGKDWKYVMNKPRDPHDYQATFKAPDKKILVIDDNESNLMVIKQLLKQTEISIDLIDNGRDAVGLCEQNKYDLILLDHMMPEFDGMDVLKTIKEHPFDLNYHTPAIVLTANATEGSREEYMEAGFDDYLSKPVDGMTLERALAKYLSDEPVEPEVPELTPEMEALKAEAIEEKTDASKIPDAGYLEEFLGEEKFKQVILYCGGREFACKVMAKVADDSLKALSRMRLALDDDDLKAYAVAAHSIKGMMGSACQGEIQVLARNHENAAKEGRKEFLENDYDKFALEVSRFCLGVQRK
ncbi:MAG: response regulator [Lachnospiraceae bacterium]|nr:response regulator [Lachnospiraceae bacterium]